MGISPKASGSTSNNDLILSYKSVRLTIGAMGFLLPVALLVLTLLDAVPFAPSISEFYHTPAREVLVAIIGAIAVFLMSYKGYAVDQSRANNNWAERYLTDRRVSWAAAIGALGVAFFPTSINLIYPEGPKLACALINPADCPVDIKQVMEPDALTLTVFGQGFVNRMHAASALLFFVALAAFCFSNFQRGFAENPGDLSVSEKREKRLYSFCGWTIALCTVVIIALFGINQFDAFADYRDFVECYKLVFWAEAIGLFAFSISWLRKGDAIETFSTMMGRTGA